MSDEDQLPKVLTPKMVADYWQCSERHVRNLINAGHLNSFRLGGRLIRIRGADVLDFERRNAEPTWSRSDDRS